MRLRPKYRYRREVVAEDGTVEKSNETTNLKAFQKWLTEPPAPNVRYVVGKTTWVLVEQDEAGAVTVPLRLNT